MNGLIFSDLINFGFEWFKSRRPDHISHCFSVAYIYLNYPLPTYLSTFLCLATISVGKYLKKEKPRFKLAVLKDQGGDLSKWWYIECYIFNISTQKLERQRLSGDKLNHFKTDRERRNYAAAEIASLNERLKAGFVIEKEKIIKKDAQTISNDINLLDAIDHCTEAKKSQGKADETIRGYKRIKAYITDYYPNAKKTKLSAVTTESLIAFFQKLQTERKIDGKTFNNYRSNLSSVFNFFIRIGKIKFNPAFHVERQVEKKGHLHIPYTLDQIKTIFDHCRKIGDMEFILFTKILFYTLCRTDEVRDLRIRDIKDNKIHFVPESNKNKRGRSNTIFPALRKEIEELNILNYPLDFYVFGSEGKPGPKPVGEGRFYKKNKRLLKALKFTGRKYTLYGFKHSGACQFYLSGFTIRQIMEIAGHTNESTTYKYLHNLGLFSSIDGMEDKAAVI